MIIQAARDVAFNLFGLDIYWYGIIMAIAIFTAIVVADNFFNFLNKNSNSGIILEFAPIIIVCGILCARLYFCCLNFAHYSSNPLEILDIREGGLSIHGGILGGIGSVIFITRKYKISFLKILDSMAVGTILGQSIGRWGNYFNSEAYGIPTNQNWGLFIPPEHRIAEFSQYSFFHPTFLYESILDFAAFGILTFILLKFGKKFTGLTFFAYLTIYSLIRFFIEQIRVDSTLNVGNIPIAVIISMLLFTVGLAGMLYVFKKRKQFADN